MRVLTNNVIGIYKYKLTNKETNIVSYTNDISSVSADEYTIEEFDVTNELWLDGKACGSIEQADRWLEAGYQTEAYSPNVTYSDFAASCTEGGQIDLQLQDLQAITMKKYPSLPAGYSTPLSYGELLSLDEGEYDVTLVDLAALALPTDRGYDRGRLSVSFQKLDENSEGAEVRLKYTDVYGMSATCVIQAEGAFDTTPLATEMWQDSAGLTVDKSKALIFTAVPTSPTSPGTKGQITADANNIYWCYDTNHWARSAKDNTWA